MGNEEKMARIPEKIRVLAPAGGMEALQAAVRAGDDEVYLGADLFSARAGAKNFTREELGQAVRYCHEYGVQVHLAVNTLLTDDELPRALELIEYACTLPVDALIVQDIGLISLVRQAAPGMSVHASTQMSLHTPAGVRWAQRIGCTRVVLAREMSLDEIRQTAALAPEVELEAFCHGALCMSVSGQCYFSAVLGGQSGNRGRCKQPCRLPFAAPDGTGHDLSLKDLSLIGRLEELRQAGICSAKIEGRMKRPEYVAGAAAACRRDADGFPVSLQDLRDLQAVFSRSGFTAGYPDGERGRPMFGTRTYEDVTGATREVLGHMRELYRTERQKVPVDMVLTVQEGEPLTLAMRDADGFSAFVASDMAAEAARTRPLEEERCREQLEKLGGTPFLPGEIVCEISPGAAAPISAVNRLRREAVQTVIARRQNRSPVPFESPRFPKPGNASPALGKKLPLRAHFLRVSQVPDLAVRCERVYLPLETPLPDLEALREKGIPVGCELPRAFFGGEEVVRRQLRQKREAGFSEVWCGTLGALALAQEEGMRIHGGFSLNVTNTASLQMLEEQKILSQELSFELTAAKAARIGGTIPRGLLIYGRLPLMLCRNCPIANAPGGCRHCEKPQSLVDRKDTHFPVICRGGGASRQIEVLNSVPLSMTDRLEQLSGIHFGVLRFTVENRVECETVLSCALAGSPVPERSTRGLFVRGWQEG